MAQTMAPTVDTAFAGERTQPGRQAYRLLLVAFTIAPLLAGIDKFLNLLTNWQQYLAPWVTSISPISGQDLMRIVGAIEIVAGVLVAFKPRIFAYVVAIWLALIIINLLILGAFYDIALRDFGLMLGAIALGRLSAMYSK
jgi:uncharacterized membrane protein HdeD (DUF308 family)